MADLVLPLSFLQKKGGVRLSEWLWLMPRFPSADLIKSYHLPTHCARARAYKFQTFPFFPRADLYLGQGKKRQQLFSPFSLSLYWLIRVHVRLSRGSVARTGGGGGDEGAERQKIVVGLLHAHWSFGSEQFGGGIPLQQPPDKFIRRSRPCPVTF